MPAAGGAQWTVQRVRDLAPDAAAIKAARALATPGPWSETGATDLLLWGRCQGSGATPYQVTVDLAGPAITCSCPSRKQPCKHGLALLLRWVTGDGALDQAAPVPPDGDARAQDRADRATEAAARKAARAAPVDPEAQAKRLARRLTLMTDGLAEFERWLMDLVRDGLATARRQPYTYWDTAAARLVDSQVPGIAERVRDMPGQLAGREDWADHLLAEVGRWYLATQAWVGREGLEPADQADLRTALGWARQGDEVLAGERIRDRWLVLGVHRTDTGRLVEQRTWVQGLDTGEVGVLLDFAGAGAKLRVAQVVGTIIDTDLARYPGNPPARFRFVADPVPAGRSAELRDATSIAGNLTRVAAMAAANPWRDRFPVLIERARVLRLPDGPVVRDADGDALPAVASDVWMALAVAGGDEVTLVGEMDRDRIRPLSAVVDDVLVPL